MEKSTSRLRVRTSLTIAITFSLLAAGWGLWHWRASLLVSSWQQQIDGVADEEAELLLRRIAETGDAGIPALAAALASDRPPVATAAEGLLKEQLSRWDSLGVFSSAPKIAKLADALAEQTENYNPATRQVAGELATIILRWPIDRSLVDREKLVADCEAVIRSASEVADRTASGIVAPLAEPDRIVDGTPAFVDQVGRGGQSRQFIDPSSGTHRMPGGGLPIESLDQMRSAPVVEAPEPPDAPISRSSSSGALTAVPRRVSADLANPLAEFQAKHPATNNTNPSSPTIEAAAPPDQWRVQASNPLRSAPATPEELFLLLRSPDEATANSARIRLGKLGLSEQQVALAWYLTDPEPRQRLQWVRRLPSLPGIDATPWLFWLAKDEDANVRLEAVTMLATSPDPQTLRRVQKIASDDDDARIRRVAERVGQAASSRRK